MNLDPPVRSEIILGSDGNFYRRDTRDMIIDNAEAAILDTLSESPYVHCFVPQGVVEIKNYTEDNTLSIPITYSHFKKCSASNHVDTFIFARLLDGFPLPRAVLVKHEEPSDYLSTDTYVFHPEQLYNAHCLPDEQKLSVNLLYNSPMYEMYVAIKNITYKSLSSGLPEFFPIDNPIAYLFGIHKETNEVVTFSLPNIYDDGRICAGQDFKDEFRDRATPSLTGKIQNAVATLYRSPFNNDLRRANIDNQFALFNSDGSMIPSEAMKSWHAHHFKHTEKRAYESFFRPISNQLLIDFAKCRTLIKDS